ncbi:MAG: hypothetical protein KDI68_00550 [Gammaproteobacteria bacterium]|nr:hypothetical protein [Gammaproteobacteria bacterium]
MLQDAKIEITIDPSLLNHFQENLQRLKCNISPEDSITKLVTGILGRSEYPLEATQTGRRKILIGYRLRSFSQPIFWS